MTGNLEALKAKYKLNAESESYLQQRLEKTGKLLDTCACVEEARHAHEEVSLKYAGETEFEGEVKEFLVPSPTVPGRHPVVGTEHGAKQNLFYLAYVCRSMSL